MALVKYVRDRELKTGIVSSSKNCQAVLQAANIENFFDIRVDGTTVEKFNIKGKPAPDPFSKGGRASRGFAGSISGGGRCHFRCSIGTCR